MTRLTEMAAVLLIACVLSSCSALNKNTVGEIQPGDYVHDFLITTDGGDPATYMWELNSKCVDESEGGPTVCRITTGTRINVSWGIYDDQFSGRLDELWSDHTYEMDIDGQPVNLEAFGSVDVKQPVVGPMRHWNVVIIAPKPGEVTVHSKGFFKGDPDPFEGSTIFKFELP